MTARTDNYLRLCRELLAFDAEHNRFSCHDPRWKGPEHDDDVTNDSRRERIDGEMEMAYRELLPYPKEADKVDIFNKKNPPDWQAKYYQALADYASGKKGDTPATCFCSERGFHVRARQEVGRPEWTCMDCFGTYPNTPGNYSVLIDAPKPKKDRKLTHPRRCSFCRKDIKDVKTLIAGPRTNHHRVYICDDCVVTSVQIMNESATSYKAIVAKDRKQ